MELTQSQSPKLREVNRQLHSLGLPALTETGVIELTAQAPKQRILSAVKRAAHNASSAKDWLRTIFSRAGLLGDQHALVHKSSDAGEGGPPEPARPADPPAQQTEPARGQKRDWYSVHVYGGKAALCFEEDTTRRGVPTIALDAATGSNREYNWSDKVRVQLTVRELPHLAAVLAGYSSGCKYFGHGEGNDKGFEIQHQGSKLFVRVWAKERPVRAVPVEPGDVYLIYELVIRQLRLRAKWMGSADIQAMLRSIGRMHG